MAFQFPVNPVVGQVFNPTPGVTYKWDGAGWVPTSSGLLTTGEADLKYVTWAGMFAVGDIFLSLSSANPSGRFGGTWQLISQGLCLVGAGGALGGVGSTGGEYVHFLTQPELPVTNININTSPPSANHTHGYNDKYHDFVTTSAPAFSVQGPSGPNMNTLTDPLQTGPESEPHVHNVSFAFGGNQSHNNIQPYLAVFIWQKMA